MTVITHTPHEEAGNSNGSGDVDFDASASYGVVDRLFQLPYVSNTVSFVSDTYSEYGKNSSIPLVKGGVDLVESTISSLYNDKAKPVIERHAGSLHKLDSIVCDQWDSVENRVINTYDSLKERKESLVRDIDNKAHAAEQVLLSPTKKLLEVADDLVELVLPSEEESDFLQEEETSAALADEDSENIPVELISSKYNLGTEATKLISQTKQLSSKVKARAVARVLSQLDNVTVRANNAVRELPSLTNEYLREAVKQLYALAEEDEEEDVEQEATEEVTLLSSLSPTKLKSRAYRHARLTARRLARPAASRLVVALEGTTSSIKQVADIVEAIDAFSKEAFVSLYAGSVDALENATITITSSHIYLRFHKTVTTAAALPAIIALSEQLYDTLTKLGFTIPESVLGYFPHVAAQTNSTNPHLELISKLDELQETTTNDNEEGTKQTTPFVEELESEDDATEAIDSVSPKTAPEEAESHEETIVKEEGGDSAPPATEAQTSLSKEGSSHSHGKRHRKKKGKKNTSH